MWLCAICWWPPNGICQAGNPTNTAPSADKCSCRPEKNRSLSLMTAYAVRGLDINTSYTIYNLLDEEKKEGVAVVYVGEDLDVLIDLCDRILVLCGGKENGILDARTTTKEEVGLLMTNLRKEGK